MKNYLAQTPQNLAVTKILQKFRKTSTPLRKYYLPATSLAVGKKFRLSLRGRQYVDVLAFLLRFFDTERVDNHDEGMTEHHLHYN